MSRAFVGLARRVYVNTPSRALRQMYFNMFARLVRGRQTTEDIDGAIYELDLGENIDIRLYLRQFEPEVAAVLRRETKPGMTVFDIGANIGAHTLLLASLVGASGRVLAFEPTDYAWTKLQRNLALNAFPWVTAVKAALSDHEASEQRVDFRSSWRNDGGRRDTTSIVDFTRLDDWCERRGISHVDLIKIDVDGNEYAIFAGGFQILSRSRPVLVMEAVSPHFEDPARNPFRVLNELDYTFRDLHDNAPVTLDQLRRRLPDHDPGMTVSTNVLAVPDDTNR